MEQLLVFDVLLERNRHFRELYLSVISLLALYPNRRYVRVEQHIMGIRVKLSQILLLSDFHIPVSRQAGRDGLPYLYGGGRRIRCHRLIPSDKRLSLKQLLRVGQQFCNHLVYLHTLFLFYQVIHQHCFILTYRPSGDLVLTIRTDVIVFLVNDDNLLL